MAQAPVVTCGSAGSIEHLLKAIHKGDVFAVATGSLLIFHGKYSAILINYFSDTEI